MTSGKVSNLEDLYELSPVQEGMLFHTLQAPGSGMYIEQLSGRLEGPLDVAAFGQAWQRLLDRHALLRTAFHWEGLDKPLQVVHRQVSMPIAVDDLSAFAEPDRQARLAERLEAERRAGFDIAQAPLMRVVLLRLGPDRHQFVWTHHHLLLDGWSVPLVMADVIGAYTALRDGHEPPHESRRPFRDYIVWLQRQDRGAAERFWREHLAGFVSPTPLAEPVADEAEAPAHRTIERRLPADATSALDRFARQHQLTLNTIVQGAWARVHGCHAGSNDVVFGAAVSGRPADLHGADRMVGLFINTLPVRVPVSPGLAVVDWLRALQQSQAQARTFEYAPLVAVQRWSEVPRGTPLFDTVLVFANYPIDRDMASGDGRLTLTDLKAVESTNYPLTIFALPEARLRLRATYDPRRFETAQVEALLAHLEETLTGIGAATTSTRVAGLAMMPAAEATTVVRTFNETAVPWPDDAAPSLDGWIREQVARTPDVVAVADEARTLTYTELWARAEGLAAQLRQSGVGPETVVAVFLDRSVDLIVAVLGVIRAGGAYLPLVPGEPAARRQWMLEDAGVSVVVTSRVLAASGEVTAARVVCVEDVGPQEPGGWSVRSGGAGLQAAYVIYTSGSTGKPKGAINTHAGIVNRLRWMQATYGLTAADVVLQKTPVSFDVSVWELFWALGVGARIVLARPEGHKDVGYLIERIQQAGVTTLHFVPSQLAAFMADGRAGQCASIRRVICSGEALSYEAKEAALARLPWAVVHNLYGPTEAAVDVTWWPCEAGGPRRVPIGRPIANTQIHIVDATLAAVPVGVAGELVIGGVNVGRGYLARPDLTAARFVPDPYGPPGSRVYRTGDRARYRADGTIEYLGRQDFQVKVRGFRIEPGEVEAVIRGVDGVADCVVVAREDRLVAYVTATAGAAAAPGLGEAIRTAARGQVPEYMVPSVIVPLAELPKLANGKIDRAALPAPDTSRPDLAVAYREPATDLEAAIADVWREVLNLDRVGVDDNFFDVGGQSLLAVRVLGKLRERIPEASALAIVELFAFPTIAALAQRLTPREPEPVVVTAPADAPNGRAPGADALAADAPEVRAPGTDRLRQQRLRRQGAGSSS